MTKDIIVLTMSYKNDGYCVAGIDAITGEWIRLVTRNSDSYGSVPQINTRYDNGEYCRPLDIIRVDIISIEPLEFQPENYLFNTQTRWRKLGVRSLQDVVNLHNLAKEKYLFGTRGQYLCDEEVKRTSDSLILIKAYDLSFSRSVNTQGKERTKAKFTYNNIEYYYMSVTDPDYYYADEGEKIERAVLVLSIPNAPYDNTKWYKFVSKIFDLSRYR